MVIFGKISHFISSVKEMKSKIKQKHFRTKTQTYTKILMAFGFLFLSIIGQAVLSKPANAYSESSVEKPIPFDAGEVTVLKKQYSPVSKSYRMDIYVDSEVDLVSDGEPITKATVVTKEDINTPLKVEVIPVSENYFVLLAQNIDDEFGALRFDVTYKRSKDSDESALSLYGSQEKSTIVKSDLSTLSQAELKISGLENDIRLQQLNRKVIEEDNKSLVEEIKNTREKIATFTEEKEYQVGEQLAKTEDSITTLENTIESFKGNISDNKTKISDIEKTIQLIESKIDELKKGV